MPNAKFEFSPIGFCCLQEEYPQLCGSAFPDSYPEYRAVAFRVADAASFIFFAKIAGGDRWKNMHHLQMERAMSLDYPVQHVAYSGDLAAVHGNERIVVSRWTDARWEMIDDIPFLSSQCDNDITGMQFSDVENARRHLTVHYPNGRANYPLMSCGYQVPEPRAVLV